MNIKIVIPSYKRAGANPSIDNLPDDIVSKYVTLAVRDEEYDQYTKAHPGVNIHNLGKGVDGIVETRQRINEQFDGKIMVIDDDNIFFHIRHGAHKKDPTNKYIGRGLRLESSEEYVEMLEYCSELLDTFEYGTMRNLNFLRDPKWDPYTLNSICYWVHFFNLDKFDYVNCSFRNGPKSGLCEDLYLPIDWFDKGNDFFTLVRYNVGETTGQNKMEGGCNTSDRGIRYKESLEQLHEMFPQYCKLKESKKNTETYGFEVPTLSIRLNKKKRKTTTQHTYNYDYWSYDKQQLLEFNWFLRKINQRAGISRGFINESYEPLRRDGSVCLGLNEDVEYFHPTITLDDRMRFIGTEIAGADMSMINIVGNTFISHFYGARGIHWLLSGKEGEFVDFDRIANDDQKYIRFIQSNADTAQANKQPIWGTTELHTSIQTAGRNFCRAKYKDSDRKFQTVDVCEWVSSFRDNGIIEGMLKSKHLSETFKLLTSQNGIGGYYGFHASTSSSALPQVEYHHDQRFVVAGPGAVWAIKQIWPNIPNKHVNEAVYFLRENQKEIGLVDGITFDENAYNIKLESGPYKGQNLFAESQDTLKYYGTEVALCQWSVYMQIRDDAKRCAKRRVARAATKPAVCTLEGFFDE